MAFPATLCAQFSLKVGIITVIIDPQSPSSYAYGLKIIILYPGCARIYLIYFKAVSSLVLYQIQLGYSKLFHVGIFTTLSEEPNFRRSCLHESTPPPRHIEIGVVYYFKSTWQNCQTATTKTSYLNMTTVARQV